MRFVRLSALIILLVLPVLLLPAAEARAQCRIKFVIYGDVGCPHCRATNKTLNSLYPGCVAFIDIGANATGLKVYQRLWDAVIRNPFYAVPFVVVEVGGEPKAFVVGERPPAWWMSLVENLTANPPSTALLCLDGCKVLSKEVYSKALKALRTPPPKVTAIVKGVPEELAESLGLKVVSIDERRMGKALRALTADCRAYAVIFGKPDVLLCIESSVPRKMISGSTTIDIDPAALRVALDVYFSAQGRVNRPVLVNVTLSEGGEPRALISLIRSQSVAGDLEALERLVTASLTRPLAVLIPALLGLAALDSINPCFLTLYTILVASSTAMGGRKRGVAVGLAVAAGVYAGYYLLGLGVSQLLAAVGTVLRTVLGVVAATMGFYVLAKSLSERLAVSRGPRECRACAWLEKVGHASLAAMFIFGLVSSWTLLPCTAGPYVAAIALIDGYPLYTRLALLAMYNVVLIAPLLAVLLGSVKLVERYERAVKYVEPLAGIALIVVGAMIALGYL